MGIIASAKLIGVGVVLALIVAGGWYYGHTRYGAGQASEQARITALTAQHTSDSAALQAADAATTQLQARARAQHARAAQALRSAAASAAKARAMDTAWRERLARAKHDDTQTQCGPVLQMHLPASVGTSY